MAYRMPVAAAMRHATAALLTSLSDDQRVMATGPFDTPEHRDWTYLPGARPGLLLRDLDEGQRTLAMALLATGLSSRGLRTAGEIMALEGVLAERERSAGGRDWERHPQHFWVRVLGAPSRVSPWAWRVNGHHLATQVTVVGNEVASTPQFFGANPAVVPCGPQGALRTLPLEEDLARELMGRLDLGQQTVAVTSLMAPWDLATRHDPVADAGLVPRGLRHGDMDAAQRGTLTRLVRHYFNRAAPEVAESSWRAAVEAGLSEVTFAWAGNLEPGTGHYYAIAGPTFLLEYDNVQNDANHVHTVWRDLRRDWGSDLLAAHHRGRL